MFDNQLFALIIRALTQGELAVGIPGLPIKQAFQPTQQGVNTQPTAYIYKLYDHRYGTPLRKNYTGNLNLTTETGIILTTEAARNLLTELGLNIITESGEIIRTEPDGEAIIIEGAMIHEESQQYETSFQLSTLSTQNPSTPAQYTASDIANLCATILQSDNAIAFLRENDVGIERITTVRNPYFTDDRARNEACPSFDFTLTHKQTFKTITGFIEAADIQIYRV